MAENQVSPQDRSQIEKLMQDLQKDKNLQMRMINNSPEVLKAYKLEGNPKFQGLIMDLHRKTPGEARTGELTALFGVHGDLEGGHNDSQGHTDGPGWHFDI